MEHNVNTQKLKLKEHYSRFEIMIYFEIITYEMLICNIYSNLNGWIKVSKQSLIGDE